MQKYLLLLLVLISTVFHNCTPAYDNPNDYKGDSYINRKGINIDDTSFIITEGASTTIDISLASIPLFDVEIDFSESITPELSISPASLTFTRENYMNAQSVTISHLDNFLVTGAAYFEVNPDISSSDPDYNSIDFPTVNIVVSDEDLAPIAVPVTPYDGQFLVSPFQQVSVKFSKDMNPDTINSSTFTVEGSSGPVSGYIFYYPRKKIAVFQCKGVLRYKHDYIVTIKSTVEDSAGNQMAAEATFSFKTKNFEPERIGGLVTTDARDVVVSKNFAYVADSASGLRIIDISNPAAPSHTGIYDTYCARGVYLQESHAYIADDVDGLCIIDVSNPAAPSSAGAWDMVAAEHFSSDVYVSGDYAYLANVASGSYEIQVINFNPPGPAGAIRNYAPYSSSYINPNAVTGTGNHLYAFAGFDIAIADISSAAIADASWPTGYTSSISAGDFCRELYADDNYLYSVGSMGVEIFDRSTPMSPVHLARCPTDYPRGVYAAYGYAFVADTNDIEIFDLSEPTVPVRAGTVGSYSEACRTFVDNYYLYLAAGTTGLEIYDLNPVKKISSYETYLQVSGNEIAKGEFDIFINGSYAFITGYNGKGTLSIIDLSNPAAPVRVGFFDDGYAATNHWFSSVHVSGDFAYITYCDLLFDDGVSSRIDGKGGLLIVDVSDPANPVARGNCATGGTAEDAYVAGGYAYVADGTNGLQAVNIANSDAPTPAGNYPTSGTASGIDIDGTYAFVSNGASGLQVLDISSPASPTIPEGWWDISERANAAVIHDGYLYIAGGTSGLLVATAFNPALIDVKWSCDTGGSAEGIHVEGNYAYIANGDGGLAVIDVSEPGSPVLKRTIALAGDSYNLSKHGSHVYVSDKEGLQILHVGPFQ